MTKIEWEISFMTIRNSIASSWTNFNSLQQSRSINLVLSCPVPFVCSWIAISLMPTLSSYFFSCIIVLSVNDVVHLKTAINNIGQLKHVFLDFCIRMYQSKRMRKITHICMNVCSCVCECASVYWVDYYIIVLSLCWEAWKVYAFDVYNVKTAHKVCYLSI